MSDIDKIKSVAIHPAIGIARVGNSPSRQQNDFVCSPLMIF